MRAFQRVGQVIEADVEEFEVALLASLTGQFTDLLGGDDAADADGLDAFEKLAAESAGGLELDRSDPLIRRLFPDAYGDPELSEEFRRFTQEDARRRRIAHATVLLDDLEATQEGRLPLRIPPEHVDAWLRTINGLRLSLSVRLGITDSASLDALERLPARDPRTHLADIYDWLGFVLESMLDAAAS